MLLPFPLQVLNDNYPVIPAQPSTLDYIPRLWQTATDTIANYQYALSLLMLLAMLRWMLFREVLKPFLPPSSPLWIIVVEFRLLSAAMFAVVNYNIYKASTKHLATSQRSHFLWPHGKPTDILYIVAGLFGVASVGYAFYRQWTAEADGLFLLDLSLIIEALMNLLLIVHEGEHMTVTAPWCVEWQNYIHVLELLTLSYNFIIIHYTH